jgi:hypothetical protein
MSLFGSREDDPLLQDDPLAPSEEDAESSSSRASDEEPSDHDESVPASEAVSPEAPSVEAESSEKTQHGGAATAGRDDRFSFDGEDARRALVRNVDDAEAGNLAVLNTAFDQGWRLERVVYREETADLLFLLQQQPSSMDRNDLIV